MIKKSNAVIHIVAGPTASGKSAYALELAQKENGVIINADSRQIYDDLPVLTAQPTEDEKKIVPHELYGALHPNETCSAGTWREMVQPLIEKTLNANKTPVIVGGTGLYIKALMEGLSPIPIVPDHIRQAANEKQIELGNPGFYEELKKRDPVTAQRFHPSHTARLIRAWEVLEATGKSLSAWQAEDKLGPPDHWDFKIHKIMPERDELYRRCDMRFVKMLDAGALDEVKAFIKKVESGAVNADSQLTNSLGLTPLKQHINGEITLEDAITQGQLETRQYAKRQMTWFRNQL